MKLNRTLLQKYTEETFVVHEKHPFADLHIYGYYEGGGKPRLWDDYSKQCRGIILDGDGNVIERPFTKFFTFKQYLTQRLMLLNDNQVARIPEGPFRITEKIDGTMTTLYWIGDEPYLATQRSFTNIKAQEATLLLRSRYGHLLDRLDREHTWIFEAVYPETNILIDYGDTRDLFLIGCIEKCSGKPVPIPDIGFPRCRDFTAQYGDIKDLRELMALNLPNQEGFVLYYENGSMVKLKFPWYIERHSLLDRMVTNEKNSWRNHEAFNAITGDLFQPVEATQIQTALGGKCLSPDTINGILSQYKNSAPSFYELFGYDWWLNKTITGDRNTIFPLPESFDFTKRAREPHIYETTMWKWKERYLKQK